MTEAPPQEPPSDQAPQDLTQTGQTQTGQTQTGQTQTGQTQTGQIQHDPARHGLTQLGRPTKLPAGPDAATLERVHNPATGTHYLVRFTCPEFTALCPLTGQPDFAHLVLDYIPRDWIVESKSLKLFLGSFRNHGAFHEACTMLIAQRLIAALDPVWLRIGGYWYPRGGMPIDVFYQTGAPPEGTWIPPQDVAPYRGRG